MAVVLSELTVDEVRARFDWALRQGNPRWLWPAVTIGEWQEALVGIERAVGQVLTEGRARAPLDGDPGALGIAAYTSGTGPLLGHWIAEGLVDASTAVTAVLDAHLEHNRARMEMLGRQACDVVQALADAGIGASILKGMHTTFEYFPEPACRPMSDIDIAIAPADNDRAGDVLAQLGFEPGIAAPYPPQRSWHMARQRREPRTLDMVHRNDPWAVDLQTSLNRRYAAGARPARLDDIRGQGLPWPRCPLARTLTQPLLTIQLAAHAGSPLFSLTLLRLVELVLVVRKDVANGRLDWPEFLAAAGRADALGHVWPALQMAERLVPGTIPAAVLEACEKCVPLAVRRVVRRLSPAKSHRVTRCSVEEHYMWSNSPARLFRQVMSDLTVRNSRSLSELSRVYWQRISRMANGTLTWR